ncbi:Multidrug resistance-associated protein 1 [Globisporangium polare]
MHRELTPATVFTSLALFQLIQAPLGRIANTINVAVRARVSANRVSKFLQLPEISADNVRSLHHPSAQSCIDENVIRACGADQIARFNAANNVKLDIRNKVWSAKLAISQWFALRIQLIGSLLVFVVAYSLILLHKKLSPAIIGLAFAYVLKISSSLELIVQSRRTARTSAWASARCSAWRVLCCATRAS